MQILTNTFHIYEPPCSKGTFIELDMGCGKGKFCLELAARYPDRFVLASDVMLGRLNKIERKRVRQGLANLELLRASNLALASYQLPPESIDRIHLLCPDPWPKKRHAIRRLVCTDFLVRLLRILKPGGILHMATDYAPYFDEWQSMLARIPSYAPCPDGADDVLDIKTDFELLWESQGLKVQHITLINYLR